MTAAVNQNARQYDVDDDFIPELYSAGQSEQKRFHAPLDSDCGSPDHLEIRQNTIQFGNTVSGYKRAAHMDPFQIGDGLKMG